MKSLTSDMLSFSIIDFKETRDSKRSTCTGRNIAVYMPFSEIILYVEKGVFSIQNGLRRGAACQKSDSLSMSLSTEQVAT